jgi:hypothetical protein
MPRTLEDIEARAEQLAAKIEDPNWTGRELDVAKLHAVRDAFQAATQAQRAVAEAVVIARDEGHTWGLIGVMLGTSGEAARQRYSKYLPKQSK